MKLLHTKRAIGALLSCIMVVMAAAMAANAVASPVACVEEVTVE